MASTRKLKQRLARRTLIREKASLQKEQDELCELVNARGDGGYIKTSDGGMQLDMSVEEWERLNMLSQEIDYLNSMV